MCTWASLSREIEFQGREKHNLLLTAIAGFIKIPMKNQNIITFIVKIDKVAKLLL